MDWTYLTLAGAALWMAVFSLPWSPRRIQETLEGLGFRAEPFPEITVLVPARDEAPLLPALFSGLKNQGEVAVVLVDDLSTDGTTREALRLAGGNLRLVQGQPPPPGWSGKLWALEQGLKEVNSPLTLLLDADIELAPGIISALCQKMSEENIQLLSLMASLRMVSFWEKLFMPAFVYFFRLLYPFCLSNSPRSRVAAAAGGCILVNTSTLKSVGAFRSFRGELIDDCALAKKVKSLGGKTWIGLTHSVLSRRPYDRLGTIWNMVARHAFAQLRYSGLGLIFCTALMALAFWLPVAGLFFPGRAAPVISAVALGAMFLSYTPTLRFYQVSGLYALGMPLIGTLYLAMTWTSAIRYWQKKGSEWKGRRYTDKNAGTQMNADKRRLKYK